MDFWKHCGKGILTTGMIIFDIILETISEWCETFRRMGKYHGDIPEKCWRMQKKLRQRIQTLWTEK